ncbi:RNA methyltransferase [bacterium]|nr:RNA methyltransferase [bacterium]
MTDKRLSLIKRVVGNRQLDLTIVLENIHDEHNVGAIFRSADAVGIQEVQLLYSKEKFPALHPKVTASGGKWVKQNKYDDPVKLAKNLRSRGFNLYTTQLNSDAVPIHEIDWTLPSAIILGNENRGVSPEIVELADKNIVIPLFGMVTSLNVSVAAAVILFEACRQRNVAGNYPNPDLTSAWLEVMTQNWIRINQKNR